MDRQQAIWLIKDHMEHHKIGEYPHILLGEALNMAIAALTQPNETPPCYQPDGDGCAYQCYDGDDEPILSTIQAENEKLRETVDKYATAARVIALHLKPFCDESLPYDEMIADAARKASDELEQVRRDRDAAVSWAQKYTESIDRPCVACKHNTGDYVCTAICGNCGPMGTESCKWEFDFSGELKED